MAGIPSYRTRDGDTVDWIAWRYYGAAAGSAEHIMTSNPGLADHGPVLPEGLTLSLPDLPKPAATGDRLWD